MDMLETNSNRIRTAPRRPSLRSCAPGDTTLRHAVVVVSEVHATRSTALARAKGGGHERNQFEPSSSPTPLKLRRDRLRDETGLPGRSSAGAKSGPKRDRTADLNTASVALSQLSYGPPNLLNNQKTSATTSSHLAVARRAKADELWAHISKVLALC